MIELTVVLKSKDMSSNNYTFITLMKGDDAAAVEKSVFSRPKDAFLPLRSDSSDAVFVSMSDVSFVSIKHINDNLVTNQTAEPVSAPSAQGAPPAMPTPPAPAQEEGQKFDISDIASA